MTVHDFPIRQGVDAVDALVITLGGKEWVIPPFGMRQNRPLIPLLWKIFPVVWRSGEAALELQAAKESGDAERLKVAQIANTRTIVELTSEENLTLLSDIVFIALTRAYVITKDEFLELPLNPNELVAAVDNIAKQTQFFTPPGGRQEAPAGEPQTAPLT